jgi:hypothetical protein
MFEDARGSRTAVPSRGKRAALSAAARLTYGYHAMQRRQVEKRKKKALTYIARHGLYASRKSEKRRKGKEQLVTYM